jgi:hypothetical protein
MAAGAMPGAGGHDPADEASLIWDVSLGYSALG